MTKQTRFNYTKSKSLIVVQQADKHPLVPPKSPPKRRFGKKQEKEIDGVNRSLQKKSGAHLTWRKGMI